MKTLAVWLGSGVLIAITIAAIGGLAYIKYLQMQAAMSAPPPPEMPIAVSTIDAQQILTRQRTTMIGTVLSPQSIMLSNEIAGTVSAIGFRPGQVVEQGQVLVELDSSVEHAQLEAARARRTIAESAYKRIREAAGARAVTPNELDEATASLEQASAQVDELVAVINRKTLRAPFRANIGLSDTHVGQFLPSGSRIASLQSIEDYMFVDFMIPQSASDSIRVGDLVRLHTQTQELVAAVIALDSQADRKSRNLMGRARTESHPEFLLPGDSVKVVIEYGDQMTTAAVPAVALRSAPMQTFVYVASKDKQGALRAYTRQVTPGATLNGWLSILSGLNVGERVVAEGSFKLRDGALITSVPVDGAESQQEKLSGQDS